MLPIFHCVRHAQGVHNLSHPNQHLPDPELTPLGEEQVGASGARLPELENIQLILSSPFQRAIQAALLAFPSKVIAWPEVQQASDLICDTGSDLLGIKVQTSFHLFLSEWSVKSHSYNTCLHHISSPRSAIKGSISIPSQLTEPSGLIRNSTRAALGTPHRTAI
ncbi:hypothetical protein N7540_000151 [Penicillium herquei]|nr:hypothetical protein N7540_000151 [Penicillium herquei]